MLYNSLNLEVAKIASKSEMKPEIAGVLFTKDKTVATDSFRLLEITTPAGLKPEEFPITPDKKTAMRGVKPFIVPASAAKEIAKMRHCKNSSLPILEYTAISHRDETTVEFLTTDLEIADTKQIRLIDGKFPDYEQIFPVGEPVAQITINGAMLAEMLEIMAKMERTQEVKLKFYGPDKPVVLEAGNDNQRSRGLLMAIGEE